MKKAVWLLVLLTLMACGPSTTELAPPETNANNDTAVSTTNETADTNETFSNPSLPAATNLDGFVPANSMEQAIQAREQDWGKGAADPLVVIIEYGDFQ
ncbi:hypothetical protein [Candidatus Leptofilum sp.]|uniref:hypothetical protein n=1 Tax=Candidatus Leptofilum sp. TaxID=3241576 RepID=UPI003B5AA5E0